MPSHSFDAATEANISGLKVSDLNAFSSTRKAFQELEGMGVTQFQMLNALADLFYEQGQPEVSKLMAEAAYRCFQNES